MADKQKAALNRLAKKLGALRATLSRDERVLLDRIVLGTDEVIGHKVTTAAATGPKAANKVTEVAVHGMAGAATTGPKASKKVTEVSAHGMTTGATTGPKASKKVTEVTAHGMTTGAATTGPKASKAANTGAISAATTLLEFDATTGGYRVTDGSSI